MIGVCIFNGIPYRDRVGVQGVETLALGCQVPQISVSLGKDNGASANQLVFVLCDECLGVLILIQLRKHLFRRDESLDFASEVIFQVIVKQLEFFRGSHLTRRHSGSFSVCDTFQGLLAQPAFRRHTVQRIMNLLPVHGEVLVLSKVLIAKHLLAQGAELCV